MSGYFIYGKVVKPIPLPDGKGGEKIVEPQPTFRALNYSGARVTKLVDAGIYNEKNMAQRVIDKVQAYWEKRGYKDHILFEIRKAK